MSVANKLGVSPLVIGLTLVGFGTSTPELVTSVQTALSGSPRSFTATVGSNRHRPADPRGLGAHHADRRRLGHPKRDELVMVAVTVFFALLDRLTHHVNIIEMNGKSYRLNQSRSRAAKADV